MQANCDFESEIVISGMSGRFPKSANLDEFWENLVNGTDMVGDANLRYNVHEYDVPSRVAVLKDLDKFDAAFFTLHQKQANVLDPRIRLLLEITYEAIADAGINPMEIQETNTGVFVAACENNGAAISLRSCSKEITNSYILLGTGLYMLANRLSYAFNLRGPSYAIDSACSSSSLAIQQALQSIRSGNCDAAIIASAQTHHDPAISHFFHQLQMTSEDGKCKSFDGSADGYVRAEAAVAIYICKKQVAKREYCTLVHATSNCDGYKEQGITFPSEISQETVMRQLYTEAGVSPLEVDYIEAHGTGTKAGDPQEMAAISKVFCEGRRWPLLVGAVKSNMGHPEPVAGLCAIAKVILAHSASIIPGNLHFDLPNPSIPSLHDGRIKVVNQNQEFNAKYVGINSMGVGGTNVHVLLKLNEKKEITLWSPRVPIILLGSSRTQEGVEVFLQSTLKHRENHSFVRLTQEICKLDVTRHEFRGYVIADLNKIEKRVGSRDFGREMWFIITGLGSQWPGMSRDMIRFEVFQKSIQKSARVLLSNNFDIIDLMENGDNKTFEDFKNSVVSVTTIQVALIDLLRSIGIHPDGIVGHSTGEVAAGYADYCLTHEQAVLVSFARARAVLESNLKPGLMASVGVTWEDAKTRCPPGVWPVIHNADENITVAGSPDDIKSFAKQLEGEGIFAKLVRGASFGFHSPLVEKSGKLAKELLEDIIPNPKTRSKAWLSSSVHESLWNTDLTKYCSADYYVTNGVSPVYFHTTILHIPEHIVVLEIGPHCFFQSILKTSLSKKAVVLGLIHVKSPCNCTYFLNSMGRCFIVGINLDVTTLYDPVQFPVSAEAPNISSMIRWDHSTSYPVPHHSMEASSQNEVKYNVNLSSEQYAFLEGHTIDGKVLFPATGYIWLVWKCFAENNGSRFENYAIVFENVRFERMIVLNKIKDADIVVNIFPASGKFEISESDNLICFGNVRNVDNTAKNEMLDYKPCDEIKCSGTFLNKEDFYKEMQLRGYGHSGLFQSIEQAHTGGQWANIKWQGEWVSFIDTLLQVFLLQSKYRNLYVPLQIQKLTIDPTEIRNHLEANHSSIIVKSWQHQRTLTCAGIEFRGVKFAIFNQKSRQMLPSTVTQVFLPYLECPQILSEIQALESSVEIAFENLAGSKFICVEVLQTPANMISHHVRNASLLKFATSEFYHVNNSNEALNEENVRVSMSQAVDMRTIPNIKHNMLFVDDQRLLMIAVDLLQPTGFILFKGPRASEFTNPGMSIVSERSFLLEETDVCSYYLLKRFVSLPVKTKWIYLNSEGFDWVDRAKETLKMLAETDRIYFISQYSRSGIAGFFNCFTKEYTPEKFRCYHAADPLELDFLKPCAIFRDQLKKDLVMNIFKNSSWGSFSNMSIPKEEFRKQKPTSIAYANALNLGELSSLSWIESPLKLEKKELIEVHCASLNFRDIMLATGKLVQDAVTEKFEQTECVLGLEFSGMFQGKRVCGTGLSECLATKIDPADKVLFEVPNNWTLEDGATVPCVYITVYIALVMRGRMKSGESILIHAGSGGVGQAAIQVALSMNCRVFTTVSTNEKREFLKARFPALTDECFTNSRQAGEFEYHINKYTKGRGVDLVLNSLAQDKLYASLRCLAINGRFLEIGKFDIFNDTKIGMSILAKGVRVFGILADRFWETASEMDKVQVRNFFEKGMKSGLIKPLSYHVFQHTQLEEAFRFMAQGKHMGKVMIQIKEYTNIPASVPAYPRTYFESTKSYIIVGGLGGMGFELAIWMVNRGAKTLILSSRSGNTTSYHDYYIAMWRRRGVNAVVIKSDISTHHGVKVLLENTKRAATIGGIFNVAVVLQDAFFENLSTADFKDVNACKADATQHLDTLSRILAPDLDYFVVFSSIVAARGNPGQTNYGFANSVMERICEERKIKGFPALAIQWGAVGDVGVFHRTMKNQNVFGLAPQSIKSCLETLDVYLQQDVTIVSSFIPIYGETIAAKDSNISLVSKVANILGIEDIKTINSKTPLLDLGMDSLMAAEVGQVIQIHSNLQLSQNYLSSLTFQKLAEIDLPVGVKDLHDDSISNKSDSCVKRLNLRPMPDKALSEMKSLKRSTDNVFVVHPIDGTVETLKDLASKLDVCVYGLEYVKDAPLVSLEKLTEFYLKKVREIQSAGPYKLCGYSFGATVAFEMALQLESQNDTVSVLILLDGSPGWNNYLKNPNLNKSGRDEWINWILKIFLSQYMATIPPHIFKEVQNRTNFEDRVNYLASQLKDSQPQISLAELRDTLSSLMKRVMCSMNYSPSCKIKAKTYLLKAVESIFSKKLEFDYGLSEMCENEVHVVEINGNHYCFYEKPDELGLAGILNQLII